MNKPIEHRYWRISWSEEAHGGTSVLGVRGCPELRAFKGYISSCYSKPQQTESVPTHLSQSCG